MPSIKVYVDKHQTSQKNPLQEERSYYWYIANGDFDIVWTNVTIFVLGHALFLQACYLICTEYPWETWFWSLLLALYTGLATGCGSHRLWSHKSYEAKWFLKLFLMCGQSVAGQNCIYVWCRDHRVHHKWSDTDADPHNTKRGYFFAHCGWLMRKKHPEMKEKSKTLDFSDLLADEFVRYQKDHYWIYYFVCVLFLPMAIPVYLWNENWWSSFLITYVLRYVTTLHSTWFVNSTAHMFGQKPYNLKIAPVENVLVSFGTFGEGYHNFHHTFPWDYRAAEGNLPFTISTKFINWMAAIGQAYNLKQTNPRMIENSKAKITKMQLNQNINTGHSHYEVNYEDALKKSLMTTDVNDVNSGGL